MADDPRAPGFAPAKVNLFLHVTGRRPDGYHLLDSLVVFAAVGDRVTAEPGEHVALTVAGPEAAGVPVGPDNLVLRAAEALRGLASERLPGARLHLDKRLPSAAGIGGGSADAAATLRVLCRFWRLAPDSARLHTLAAQLGADVPVCLEGRAARMRGIGEHLSPAPPLPPFWLVLVNPCVPVPTGRVFAELDGFGAPAADILPAFADFRGLVAFLAVCRNDLEAPALREAPAIGEVLGALRAAPDCLLARMSGSGATCFGLFASAAAAEIAASGLRRANPGWWVEAAAVLRDPALSASCVGSTRGASSFAEPRG